MASASVGKGRKFKRGGRHATRCARLGEGVGCLVARRPCVGSDMADGNGARWERGAEASVLSAQTARELGVTGLRRPSAQGRPDGIRAVDTELDTAGRLLRGPPDGAEVPEQSRELPGVVLVPCGPIISPSCGWVLICPQLANTTFS